MKSYSIDILGLCERKSGKNGVVLNLKFENKVLNSYSVNDQLPADGQGKL